MIKATAALIVATTMQGADATIVNVALPQLQSSFGAGVELGAWVMGSYLCATAVAAPLTGWLRSRYGARRVFVLAVAVFVFASLMCAIAASAAALLLFRVVQGAAGGLIFPLSQSVLLDFYPKSRHPQLLGMWGAAIMVGPILGPLLGGIVTDLASWHWVFAINLPLGIFAIWGVGQVPEHSERSRIEPIDWPGILLLVTGTGGLQLCLERGVGRSWLHSPELVAEAAVAALSFAALGLRARYAGFTILRPEIFRNLNFVLAAIFNFLISGWLFATLVLLPALSEGPLGSGATFAGFTIVPRAVFMMLMMLWTGRLIGHLDCRILLIVGACLTAAGLAVLSAVPLVDPAVVMILGSSLQAIGTGMVFTPLGALAYSTLAPGLRTDAAGLYSLFRQLGCASAVALMTALLRHRTEVHLLAVRDGFLPSVPLPPELVNAASLQSYADCFELMAVWVLLASPALLLFRTESLKRAAEQTAAVR